MLDPPWDAENQISIALSRSVSQNEGPTSCQFSMKIIISLWTSCVCVCGFVWGVGGGGYKWTLRQRSRDTTLVSSTFTNVHYEGLVVGKTISVIAHFKLVLFHLLCRFLLFLTIFSTLDLFLKVTSAVKPFFAIKWPLIVIASHYFFMLRSWDI